MTELSDKAFYEDAKSVFDYNETESSFETPILNKPETPSPKDHVYY